MASAGKIDIKLPTSEEIAEVMRPLRLSAIVLEFVAEVGRARTKHGTNADLADGTGPGRNVLSEHGIPCLGELTNGDLADQFKHVNDKRSAEGRKHTRAGIVLEEFFEALEDGADIRAELVQTGAMILDWIADLDVRSVADAVDVEEPCS